MLEITEERMVEGVSWIIIVVGAIRKSLGVKEMVVVGVVEQISKGDKLTVIVQKWGNLC